MVCDPKMADRVEGVGEDNSLWLRLVTNSCLPFLTILTYPVSHPHLKDRTVLLHPSLCYLCMIGTKLEQASKQRKTWYFRKAFDMRCVSPIEQLVQEEAQDSNASNVNWYRHVCGKPHFFGRGVKMSRREGETRLSSYASTGSICTYTRNTTSLGPRLFR